MNLKGTKWIGDDLDDDGSKESLLVIVKNSLNTVFFILFLLGSLNIVNCFHRGLDLSFSEQTARLTVIINQTIKQFLLLVWIFWKLEMSPYFSWKDPQELGEFCVIHPFLSIDQSHHEGSPWSFLKIFSLFFLQIGLDLSKWPHPLKHFILSGNKFLVGVVVAVDTLKNLFGHLLGHLFSLASWNFAWGCDFKCLFLSVHFFLRRRTFFIRIIWSFFWWRYEGFNLFLLIIWWLPLSIFDGHGCNESY